ncbi:MAG: hypothetical protein FWH26_08855 [Oscillospiraceae bacterium]|nr:hypothetical protein [Oscillospiraceae bacterium]
MLTALAIGVAVLAVLNRENAAEKKRLLNDAVFLIVAAGSEHQVSMEDIEALEPREIEAIYKKSGKDPETRTYTGVPFAAVLRAKGIDTGAYQSAAFAAADGYASALPMADALDETSCFIVIDGGDEGPFRMILAKDPFSQRWCKLLTDVTLK